MPPAQLEDSPIEEGEIVSEEEEKQSIQELSHPEPKRLKTEDIIKIEEHKTDTINISHNSKIKSEEVQAMMIENAHQQE